MKPNCHQCQHRRRVPGDAHSRCEHPAVVACGLDANEFAAMGQAMTGRFVPAIRELRISGHPHGIRNGWFMWPANFDPTWLQSCEGFTAKVEASAEAK